MSLRDSTHIFADRINTSAVYWYSGLLEPDLVAKLSQTSPSEASSLINNQKLLGRIDLEKTSRTNWQDRFRKVLCLHALESPRNHHVPNQERE